jgi:5'-3' exonuclease
MTSTGKDTQGVPRNQETASGEDFWSKSVAPLIVVVDSNNIMHRAHHALSRSGLSRPDGQPVWALHGAATTIAKVIERTRPQALVVAVDAPGGCPHRRTIHPGYKANRGAPAGDLLPQLAELPLLFHTAGLSVGMYAGWEADDIMASVADWSERSGWRCEIVTSDRDAYQLLSSTVRVRKPDLEIVDMDALMEKHGVTPRQYLELAALRGEPGDNIDGVPGVGEKTAQKILAAAGSVAAIFEDPDRWRSITPRGVDAVIASREVVERNLRVAELRRDLPVDIFAERGRLPVSSAAIADAFGRAGLPAAARSLTDAMSRLS